MNRLFGTLPIAVALALSPVSMAQVDDTQPSIARYFNAALEYWRIWETTDSELVNLLIVAEKATITEKGSPANDALLKLQPNIQSLIRASQMPICDWQIDFSKGLETRLPHLRKVRSSARILVLDGRRLIGEKDSGGASIRAVAALNIGSHVGQDNHLIGSLVDMAIVALTCEFINDILDTGTTTQVDRDMMLATLNQYDEVDPFDVLGSIMYERELVAEWIEREFTGDDSRGVPELLMLISNEDDIEDHPIIKYTDEDLIEDLAKFGPAYDALVSAWAAEDILERFDEIDDDVRAGEYGELAKLLMPSLRNVRQSSDLVDSMMARTRERLAQTKDQVLDPTKNPTSDSDG